MALKTYNNNSSNNITNTTYSNVTFSNSESRIMQSRFSISYFNKLMKISIALRNNAGTNDQYATYDTENQISVYVSPTKAYILADMMHKLLEDNAYENNVCIELKNGLLKVSNGAEFGSSNPCISISYADESGNVNEVVYETKGADNYTGSYNYKDGSYSTESYPLFEVHMIEMALLEYYKASSYAIAASIMEASMYKRNSQYEAIKAIAEKVGAQIGSSGGKSQFNNKTFLSGGSSDSGNGGGFSGTPKGYETTTFDSIAGSID